MWIDNVDSDACDLEALVSFVVHCACNQLWFIQQSGSSLRDMM